MIIHSEARAAHAKLAICLARIMVYEEEHFGDDSQSCEAAAAAAAANSQRISTAAAPTADRLSERSWCPAAGAAHRDWYSGQRLWLLCAATSGAQQDSGSRKRVRQRQA